MALIIPGNTEDVPMYARVAAALTTSALGITIANPQMLSKYGSRLAASEQT